MSNDKKSIYFRTGISYGELTGKSWKLVSHLPINITNQQLVNEEKNLNQQLDNISISSQDSCFSTQDNENCAWIWISASSCSLNADAYLQFSSPSLGSQASLSQSMGSNLVDQSIGGDECEWRSKILLLLHERYA